MDGAAFGVLSWELLSNPAEVPKVPRVQVRLVWRLVLCLFLHLMLLIGLAIYLEFSLNSAHYYAPMLDEEEAKLESLDTLPVLLGAMDSNRRAYQKSGDARDLAAYTQGRQTIDKSLTDLESPLVLPSEMEQARRSLVHQWLSDVGDTIHHPTAKSADLDAINQHSEALLLQLRTLSEQVRQQVHSSLARVQDEEARESASRVNWMWIMVGSVTAFTILIQLALSNSIIAPIQTLIGVVRRLQGGDYTARARLRSGDEIQSLGETFNAMAENILHNQQELQEKNGRLSLQQEELQRANAGLEERVVEKTEQIQHALAELGDKNEKLNQAARLKDEFLATLSHELRTPLTPVIACADLLASDLRLTSENLKNVRVIERNARALSRMIDELLDLSTVMNRKMRLTREATEMNEWTRATLATLQPVWEKKKLAVTFVPADQPVILEIDPTRLAQVLTNLVNNAIKFTSPEGRITVTLEALPDEILIAVKDNGAGLNREELGKIFEMFHQAPVPAGPSLGGLGVGLTVARSLAELHGGGLHAESGGPTQGSTFTLWLPRLSLPVAEAIPPGPAPVSAPLDLSVLRGRRILLVEDSPDACEALQRILQRRECLVTTAHSGEQALDRCAHEVPELIISDIGLPGISGLEFMTRLRARPGFRNVIALALSGLGRDQDIQGAATAGFDAYYLKPVDIRVLEEAMIRFFETKPSHGASAPAKN